MIAIVKTIGDQPGSARQNGWKREIGDDPDRQLPRVWQIVVAGKHHDSEAIDGADHQALPTIAKTGYPIGGQSLRTEPPEQSITDTIGQFCMRGERHL